MRSALFVLFALGLGCTRPTDDLEIIVPDDPVAVGATFTLRLARGVENGVLCDRPNAPRSMRLSGGPDLTDCRLGHGSLTITDLRCDDDACVREKPVEEPYRVRVTKEGVTTLHVRVRSSVDGKELAGEVQFSSLRGARIELSPVPPPSDPIVSHVYADFTSEWNAGIAGPFSVEMSFARQVKIFAVDGRALAGDPAVEESPRASIRLRDGTLAFQAKAPGVVDLRLRAGDAVAERAIRIADL